MRQLPIYQMSFNTKSYNETTLHFTSEIDSINEFFPQSLLFTIPLLKNISSIIDIEDYLIKNIPVFQIEIDENLILLRGKYQFPYLTFREPQTGWYIKFEILDLDSILYRYFYHPLKTVDTYKYDGEYKGSLPNNYGFLLIQPVDLLIMDELFLKYNVTFIGLTPAYTSINEFLD